MLYTENNNYIPCMIMVENILFSGFILEEEKRERKYMKILMIWMKKKIEMENDQLREIKKNSKVSEPLNPSRKVDSNHFHNISTRMSPNSLYLAVKSLLDEQRILLIDNGYGGLLKI